MLAIVTISMGAMAQPPDMASITVVLDTVPDDDQDFEFTTSGNPLPASFLLDDDAFFAGSPDPNTLQETWTSGLVPAGVTYSIDLVPIAGWNPVSATCDNGDAPGSIAPDPGVNVTCTFVNEASPGSITVTKTVEGVGQSAWSFDIAIDPIGVGVSSPQSPSGTGDGSDMVTFEPLVLNQTYTIIEPNLPAGWAQTSFTCTVADENPATAGYQVTITGPGQDIACEIINTTLASITVILDAVPDDDQDFEFTTSGNPLPATFLLDDDAFFAGSADPNTLQETWTSGLVPAGVGYSIDQLPVTGWSLVSATCDDGSAPGSIIPDPGVNVTCTFVNVAGPDSVTVTRSVPGLGPPWLFGLVVLLLLTVLVQHRADRVKAPPVVWKR